MKPLQQKLNQVLAALEFANVGTMSEFERLLESRASGAPDRDAATQHAARHEQEQRRQERCRASGQIIQFRACAERAALKPVGQH